MQRAPLTALAIASIVGGTFAMVVASQGTPPQDDVQFTVRVTGSINVSARDSPNYVETRELSTLKSEFTQSIDFRMTRVNGKFGGAPTRMFDFMSGTSLLRPVMPVLVTPSDSMDQKITGDIDITTCKTMRLPRIPVHAGAMGIPSSAPNMPGMAALLSQMTIADRGTFYVQSCDVDADRLLVFYVPPPGMFTFTPPQPVKCSEDYTFEYDETGGVLYDGARIEDKMKAAVEGDCAGHDRRPTENMLYMGAVSFAALARGDTLTLTRRATGLDGNKDAADEPFREMTIAVTMDLVPGVLEARIMPMGYERGPLTADGSRSLVPPGHSIQKYEWTFTPANCPEAGRTVSLSGAQVSFIGLCDVKATLVVTDDRGKTAKDERVIPVKARAWRTTITNSNPTPEDFEFHPAPTVNIELGFNRCASAGHFSTSNPDRIANHWFEPSSIAVLTDYETATFELSQVSDIGPFDGLWYVGEGHFDLKRTLWINSRLLPGGSVHGLAPFTTDRSGAACDSTVRCQVGQATTARFVESIVFHERMHSTLAERALKNADPAPQVEQAISQKRQQVKDNANKFIGDAQTLVLKENTEDKVEAAVAATHLFDAGGCVGYPGRSTPPNACYRLFSTFARHR